MSWRADVIRVVSLASDYAMVNASISLGDIDGDGVSDATERIEETDPYDALNFLFRATVIFHDSDYGKGITNYIGHSNIDTKAN